MEQAAQLHLELEDDEHHQQHEALPLLDLPDHPLVLIFQGLDAKGRRALFTCSKAVRARACLTAEVTWVARCSAESTPAGGLLLGEPPVGVRRARMLHDVERLPAASIERFFKRQSALRHLLAACQAALRDLPTRQLLAGVTHISLQVRVREAGCERAHLPGGCRWPALGPVLHPKARRVPGEGRQWVPTCDPPRPSRVRIKAAAPHVKLPTRKPCLSAMRMQAWDLDAPQASTDRLAQHLLTLSPRLLTLDLSTCVPSAAFLRALQRELDGGGGDGGGGAGRSTSASGGQAGGEPGGSGGQGQAGMARPRSSSFLSSFFTPRGPRLEAQRSSGLASRASTQQRSLKVCLPPDSEAGVVEAWQAAFPSLQLMGASVAGGQGELPKRLRAGADLRAPAVEQQRLDG